jgi:hypothetical protein
MPRTAGEIFEEARQLLPSEREWVAHGLLIDGPEELDAEWTAEVERRVSEIDSGIASTCSWEELEARLRARLSQ